MKNLKTILFALAFGLIGNTAFAQSTTVKVDKKSIQSTPKAKSATPSSNNQVKKTEVKYTSKPKAQPASNYTPPPTNSNQQENKTQSKNTTNDKFRTVEGHSGNGTIPSSSLSKGKSESKK